MRILRMIAYVLVVMGAILWGIVGIFNYNLVSAIFGDETVISRILFSLVGIAGIALLAIPNQDECYCESSDMHY